MPAKFKESVKVLVNRDAKKYKTINYFMHATTTKELVSAYDSTSTTPKRKQAIRNELIRRRVSV
jgi:hypothetical protein